MDYSHILKTADFFFCYIVIQLGYAAIMSIPLFIFVLLIRLICPKKLYGYRLLLWSPILLVPLLARLKIYYETKFFVKTLYWWYILCGEHRVIVYLYILSSLSLLLLMTVNHRKMKATLGFLEQETLYGETVYITDLDVGAFSTGVLRPKIIISRSVLNENAEEDIRLIILHEKEHIHSGHLLMLFIWNVLRIVYWLNPLFHICIKLLREDIELNCDMRVLKNSNTIPHDYGKILLNQITHKNEIMAKNTSLFLGGQGFSYMKSRLQSISEYKKQSKLLHFSYIACICTVVLTCAVMLITNSYPRYTPLTDVYIYNYKIESLLTRDESELKGVIEIHEDYIDIDMDKLHPMLPAKSLDEDWLFLSWGGYLKLPGMGGAGNGVFIDEPKATGKIRIPYINNEKDLDVQLIKWM